MIRTKMLAVLVGMIATLAVTAVPAFAEFESNSTATKGAGKGGAVVLEGGGATLECASAEGTWTVLSNGVAAKQGKTLQLNVEKWNTCKASTSSVKGVTAEVGACILELTQAKGETKAKGAIVKDCTVKTKVLGLGCTITTPAGKSQEKINFGLETNTLENSGTNLLTKAEDTGITTKPAGAGCLGVKETHEAKQKGTVTNEGVKEI
jgi:hypothetical protein